MGMMMDAWEKWKIHTNILVGKHDNDEATQDVGVNGVIILKYSGKGCYEQWYLIFGSIKGE
jgi:hypothetical protein